MDIQVLKTNTLSLNTINGVQKDRVSKEHSELAVLENLRPVSYLFERKWVSNVK